MGICGSARWRDRTAIAGSIAFHACVLAALALLPAPPVPKVEPDDQAIIATIVRVERRPPEPRARPVRPPPPALPLPTAAPAVKPALAVPITRERRSHASGLRPRPPVVVRSAAPLALVIPATRTAPPVTPRPPTPRPPTPRPSPKAHAPAPSTIAEATIGLGNLGETWPSRPMPGLLEGLRAKIAGHAVVRIELDERGRALSITIVSGLDDPALREEIRAQLAGASYIPARCNGVDCPDTLTIRV
jgi:hypothetical protein